MTVKSGRHYVLRKTFRGQPFYDVRRTVVVAEVTDENRVWFTCPNGESRFLPIGQFANQYFDATDCDY